MTETRTIETILWNDRITYSSAANVSALSEACSYGEGAFETVLVHDGRPILFEEHLLRLEKTVHFFGWPTVNLDTNSLRASIDTLVSERGIRYGVLRLALFRDDIRTHRLLTLKPPRPNMEKSTLRVTCQTLFEPPLAIAGHKTNNYLFNRVAMRKAQEKGWDEVLFIHPEKGFLEASTSNVFFIQKDRLITPPLEWGILPGIVRQWVLKTASEEGISAIEKSCGQTSVTELESATVFLTNSLIGLKPVRHLDGLELNPESPLLHRFQLRWADLLKNG